jgi:U32 family peptidase
MKLITTLYHINELKKLSKYADGFIVSNENLGTRLTKSFSFDEINQVIDESKALNKEVFLSVNQIFNDQQIILIKEKLLQIKLDLLDGIIIADIGLIKVFSDMNLSSKVVYNPETLMTNVYDFNFLIDFKIKGVYVAKEITLEDLLYIASKKKYQMFLVGHGHLNMFYSKRHLIDNFMIFQDEENIYQNRQDLKIIEEKRADEPYPILEDLAGTHVFRSNVFQSIEYIDLLKDFVNYLIVDTIFKDDEYALKVLKMYKEEHIDFNIKNELEVKYHEKWDEGFFHKKTIYKSKV